MQIFAPDKLAHLEIVVGSAVCMNLVHAIHLELANAKTDLQLYDEDPNLERIVNLAHSLKACGQTIGLEQLAAHSAALEAAALAKRPSLVTNFVQGLKPVIDTAITTLHDHMQGGTHPS